MDRFKPARLAVPCMALAMAALAACDGSQTTAPEAGSIPLVAFVGPGDGQVQPEHFELCKFGTAATFDVTITPNGGGTSTMMQVSLADGECKEIHQAIGAGDLVTVTEIVPAGFQVDHIEKTVIASGVITTTTLTGTNTVSGLAKGTGAGTGPEGTLVKFFNTPLGGGEGCTPGYWKQSHHFDSWPAPYTPSTLFSSVFENAFPGKTLLQVLQQGGGGLNALGRHTVAALLNAASSGVSYDLSVSDVISGFNGVFPGGDYEGQKNIFAGFNEQGCPLN